MVLGPLAVLFAQRDRDQITDRREDIWYVPGIPKEAQRVHV